MDTLFLEKAGFSPKEAAVYLTLVHYGKLTVASIATKSKIKRSTVYLILASLGEKGLVKQTVFGKRVYYLPENPKKISDLIAIQKKELDSKLPALIDIFKKATKEPEISTFFGKDGVKKIYKDVQVSANHAKSIFSPGSFNKVFSRNESNLFSQDFVSREARLDSLFPDDLEGRRLYKEYKKEFPKNKIKLLPSDYDLSVNSIVWGDKVALVSYENLFGVVINNREIAKSFDNQFDWWWSYLK